MSNSIITVIILILQSLDELTDKAVPKKISLTKQLDIEEPVSK